MLIGGMGNVRSKSVVSVLARPDADCIFDGDHKDFTVSDFSCFRGFPYGVNHFGDDVVCDDDLDLDLWEEVHGVFTTPVDFGMTLLPAKAFDFADGHALDSDFGKGRFYVLQLEGFDDGFYELHVLLGFEGYKVYPFSPWWLWSRPFISSSSLTRMPLQTALRMPTITTVATTERATAAITPVT